jgi:hypothetical protein
MSFLQHYLATYVQYQVWIVIIHGGKLRFLQKKPEEWSDDGEKSDHPYDVQQDKLCKPMEHLVEALIHEMDPLGQYKNIQILTGPELLQSKKQKQAQKKACQLALTYSSTLFPPKEYGIEQAKTVYFSRKDGGLPIVINSGASYSVTPNFQYFVGPIWKCSTKELNGLNAPIHAVGEGEVDWKIQDVFATVRSIRTTVYYVPEASVRLFSPQIYFLKWKHGSYNMDHAGIRLTLKDGTSLTFPYNSGSSLPLMLTTKHFN